MSILAKVFKKITATNVVYIIIMKLAEGQYWMSEDNFVPFFDLEFELHSRLKDCKM